MQVYFNNMDNSNEAEIVLFTSESVGEGHPGEAQLVSYTVKLVVHNLDKIIVKCKL